MWWSSLNRLAATLVWMWISWYGFEASDPAVRALYRFLLFLPLALIWLASFLSEHFDVVDTLLMYLRGFLLSRPHRFVRFEVSEAVYTLTGWLALLSPIWSRLLF